MTGKLKSKRARLLVLALTLMLVLTSIVYAAPNEKANTAFNKKVLARVDAERALEHIRYLSEEIGPRVATTEEERRAALYIKDVFKKYGYEPKIQEFTYDTTEAKVIINSLDNKELISYGASGENFTGYKSFTGELVDCGLGLLESEFPSDVQGKIALIRRGSDYGIIGYFSLKAANALNAGAKAVLLYSDDRTPVGPSLGAAEVDIPVAMVSNADGEELKAKMSELDEGQYIQATVGVEKVSVKSQNVIAVREPKKDNDGIVYVTAHYDSVPGAPGANDNASGTAMMLEFARILKAYPIDKEVRFIACGAEEVGLEGSYYYVNQLTDEEIERSIANFNMDMIATSYEECTILEISTIDGEENYVTELAAEAGAKLGNLTQLETDYGVSSDHRYFGYLGIPHGGFIWRSEDGQLEPWYHTPQDTIEQNISLERYQKAGEIIGSALYEAIRKQTPNLERSAIRSDKVKKIKFEE